MVDKTPGVTWDPLVAATATVTYVEFANRTEYGSDTSARRIFAGEWAGQLNYYKLALAAYQEGGAAALEGAMSWKNEPATDGGRAAWFNLHQIEEQKGLSGMATELTQLADVKIPSQ